MKKSNNIYIWLTVLLLSIIWGSSFMLIKKSLLALSPYEVGAMRILITAISLTPVLWIYRSTIEWNRWPLFLVIALTGSGLPSILYPLAETHIDSSIAGVLNSLSPLFTLVFSVLIFKNKIKKQKYFGVVLGLIGAMFMLGFSSISVGETKVFYAMLILLATMLYGMNANLVKQFFQDTKAIIITAYTFVLLSPAALAFLIYNDTIPDLLEHPQAVISFSAVMILALIGTSLATFVFFKLLQKTDAVFGASVAYLIPIIAIALGLFDGEHFGLTHIIGTILILIALKIISKSEKVDTSEV